MRTGYILLHREAITREDWKSPRRTLAWIDFLTLAEHKEAVVTASYGFLADRWGVSKSTAHDWINIWVDERAVERLTERSSERNAERFFVVNYAKYQRSAERSAERKGERQAERKSERRYKGSSSKSVESNQVKDTVAKATEDDRKTAENMFYLLIQTNPAEATKYAKQPKVKDSRVASWAEDIEKMRRLDGVTHHQIDFLLKWLFETKHAKNALFWRKNIRSGKTLREKWPTLIMACKEDADRGKPQMPNLVRV